MTTNSPLTLPRSVIKLLQIEGLRDKRAVRRWFPLGGDKNAGGNYPAPDADKFGEVELLLKWHYNPALDFSDLEDEEAEDPHPDKVG